MNTGLGIPSSGGSGQVLLSGALKKRDGLVVKKWIDVYVELRENSLTCFGSADKSSILDTLVIDAGIEFVFTEKDRTRGGFRGLGPFCDKKGLNNHFL